MPNFQEFEEYYKKHLAEVFGYVYLRSRQNRQLAEDLVSEIFLKAVENFDQFNGEKGPFKAWIFRIAKNHIIDYFRCNKSKESKSLEDLANVLKDNKDTQKIAASNIENEMIYAAVNELTEDKKELIAMRYFSGYTAEEVAEITGDTANNIRVKSHRILQELKNRLIQLDD